MAAAAAAAVLRAIGIRVRGGNSAVGVQKVAEGTANGVNIFFVHGFNGHCTNTWRRCDDDNSDDTFAELWPVVDLHTQVRSAHIYMVGHAGGGSSALDLVSVETLANQLRIDLADALFESNRRAIFVCHSQGGLVVKQLFVNAPEWRNRISAIYFISTPHAGFRHITQALVDLRGCTDDFMAEIAWKSPYLTKLQNDFINALGTISENPPRIVSYQEDAAIMGLIDICSEESASFLACGEFRKIANSTHGTIAKSTSPVSPLVRDLVLLVKEVVRQGCP